MTPPYQQLEKKDGGSGVNVYNSDKTLEDGHKWNTNSNENGKVLRQGTGIFWKFYLFWQKILSQFWKSPIFRQKTK